MPLVLWREACTLAEELFAQKELTVAALVISKLKVFDPIVIDENKVVLAGHARLKAAKALGMKTVLQKP